jgi:hypothetical protein
LQAAIDRAEMKWRELQSQAAPGRSLSKLFATLPRGAELYRRQQSACFCANGSAGRSGSIRYRTADSWPTGIRT